MVLVYEYIHVWKSICTCSGVECVFKLSLSTLSSECMRTCLLTLILTLARSKKSPGKTQDHPKSPWSDQATLRRFPRHPQGILPAPKSAQGAARCAPGASKKSPREPPGAPKIAQRRPDVPSRTKEGRTTEPVTLPKGADRQKLDSPASDKSSSMRKRYDSLHEKHWKKVPAGAHEKRVRKQ